MDGRKFRNRKKILPQKIFLHLYHHLLAVCVHAIVKIQVWNIWADKNKIIFSIAGNMIAYMPDPVCSLYIYDFIFGVKMPIKQIVQIWGKQYFKGTANIRPELFQNDFQMSNLSINILFFQNLT